METKKPSKLQFRIDLVLTVLFICTIFYFLIGTIVWEHGLWGHTFYMRYVSDYLEDSDDYTTWELVEASIRSLDNFISGSLHGTQTLGKVNSAFQYALGKRLVSTGGTQMIRLNTGHLYDLQTEVSMEDGRDNILRMREIVPEDIPFLFVYEHATLYDEEAQMPEGYGFLDYATREADEIVGALRDADIEVIDSRDVFPASGVPMEEYLMYTDQHWSTRGAIIMAQTLAKRISERTGIELPVERLDIDSFEATLHPKLFLGKYGQRVGTALIDPDDIITYVPKYPTNVRLITCRDGVEYESEGPFEDTLMRKRALALDAGKTYSTLAYADYGLVDDYDIIHNEDGADCTVLLLKDSYSAPVGRFMSLVVKDVYSYDMRSYYSGSLEELVEKCDPDIVIVAYCLQMLRNDKYEFE